MFIVGFFGYFFRCLGFRFRVWGSRSKVWLLFHLLPKLCILVRILWVQAFKSILRGDTYSTGVDSQKRGLLGDHDMSSRFFGDTMASNIV